MAGRAAAGRPVIGRTLYARAVFLDTGAFLALANTSEGERHTLAVECLKQVLAHRLPFLTSLPVIYEAHRRLLFDIGSEMAREFLDRIFDGSIQIVRALEPDETKGRELIATYPDLTLTDAVSMAIMLRIGVAVCFGFDRHFLQAGFYRIPPFHL